MSNTETKNVTRAELAEAVYHEVGLSLNESAKLLDQVLEEISKVLEKGETVKLSSFGSFVEISARSFILPSGNVLLMLKLKSVLRCGVQIEINDNAVENSQNHGMSRVPSFSRIWVRDFRNCCFGWMKAIVDSFLEIILAIMQRLADRTIND